MIDIANVSLYGNTIGSLKWDSASSMALFEYSPQIYGSGIEPSPIMMPVRPGMVYSFPSLGKDTFKGLPGMIADALPDTYGRTLFDQWLALTGRTAANPLETLCYLGKRCMGALEFEPAMELPYERDTRIEIEALVAVANEALVEKSDFGANLNADKKAALADIVRLGTSAGGQRAKAIIAYNPDSGEVKSGQVDAPDGFDHYLIKLDGVSAETGFRETQNFGRLEYSFYRLVRQLGIEMSESSLIEENGRAHFLTRRFDRNKEGKVHIQTLCGIAHYDYGMPRAFSYQQAFNVMRLLNLPYSDFRELFRRMVLNVVIRNQDDHTKNISFMMNRMGKWSLAPAYDVGYAFNPEGGWTAKHQMSINGKFDNITRGDLKAIASQNDIRNSGELIDEIIEAAAGWPELARESGVPEGMIKSIIPHFQLSL